MKGISRIILGLSITYPLGVFAQPDLPPPPPLEAYIAYKAPRPIQERVQDTFWFLRGFYVTGYLGYSWVSVNDIDNVSPVSGGTPPPPVVKDSISQSKAVPGVAIGYQFRPSGFFDRAEISYMPRLGIDYNANPFLQNTDSTIKGDLSIHPILVKLYSDFDLGYPVVPYFQFGAGVAINNTSSTATINIDPNPFVNILFTGSSSDTQTNVAGDIGVGARWHFSQNFALDAGYEFDYLGAAKWNLTFLEDSDPNTPTIVNLESKRIFSNTVYIGLSWQPVPIEAHSQN